MTDNSVATASATVALRGMGFPLVLLEIDPDHASPGKRCAYDASLYREGLVRTVTVR